MTISPRLPDALSLEPGAARPGEIVRVRFALPNVSDVPAGAGSITFVLDPRFEPLDDTVVAVDAVPPGASVVGELRARIAVHAGADEPLTARAIFHTSGTSYESDVVLLAVRTQAILDGPRSGTFVDAGADGTITVRAVVVNEGDGPARGLRIEVPVPAGCRRPDGGDVAVAERERLDPGEDAALAFGVHVVARLDRIEADRAAAVLRDGTRVPLPPRTAATMPPELRAPHVAVHAGCRTSSIVVVLHNDGWTDARDVDVAVILPSGLRPRRDGVTIDGVPVTARAPRNAGGRPLATAAFEDMRVVLAIDAVPARDAARIEIEAAHTAGCAHGIVRVEAAGLAAEAPFAPRVDRAIRLRVETAAARAACGAAIAVQTAIANSGDVAERVSLAVEGADGSCEPVVVAVVPGRVERCTLQVALRSAPADGPADLAIVARDDSGERARAPIALWLYPPPDVAEEQPVRCADALHEGAAPAVRLRFDAPPEVDEGCAFAVVLCVEALRTVAELRIAAAMPARFRLVPGSTTIDGLTIRETAGTTPLERGLVLRGVAADARITVRWRLVAGAEGAHAALRALVRADGETAEIDAVPPTVVAAPSFASADERLPYRLANSTLAPSAGLHVPAPDASALRAMACVEPRAVIPDAEPARCAVRLTFFALDDVPAAAARLIAGETPASLAGYLPVLAALFPTAASSAPCAPALIHARNAIVDAFERLHVLFRLPEFTPRAEDLEDAAQRRALIALYASLGEPHDAYEAFDALLRDDTFGVEMDRATALEMLGTFADARFGSASAMRAVVALIPTRCDEEPLLSAALARYVGALDDALRRCEQLPGDAAERALGARADAALEDARAALTAALRARTLAAAAR